jgi:hypothetical protein
MIKPSNNNNNNNRSEKEAKRRTRGGKTLFPLLAFPLQRRKPQFRIPCTLDHPLSSHHPSHTDLAGKPTFPVQQAYSGKLESYSPGPTLPIHHQPSHPSHRKSTCSRHYYSSDATILLLLLLLPSWWWHSACIRGRSSGRSIPRGVQSWAPFGIRMRGRV